MNPPSIVVTGGGTGGHLFSALSFLKFAENIGFKCTFIGSKFGIERKTLPNSGANYILLNTRGFAGKDITTKTISSIGVMKETIHSMKLLKSIKPLAVIGFGGYTTIPVLVAARILKLKTAIVEQNSIPGKANRVLSRLVNHVFVNFSETSKYFNNSITVGNPMRFKTKPKIKEWKTGPLTIGVVGGSRGARRINHALMEFAEVTKLNITVIHQTGEEDFLKVMSHYKRYKPSWRALPFIEDMPSFYKNLHLIISRSGAGSLSEIACFSIPSVLVPYPYAIYNHQAKNANIFKMAGASIVISDKDLSGKKLESIVSSLTPGQLKEMSKRTGRLCKNNACERIMEVLLSV